QGMHVEVVQVGVEGQARQGAARRPRKATAIETDVIVFHTEDQAAHEAILDPAAGGPPVLSAVVVRRYSGPRRAGEDLQVDVGNGIARLAVKQEFVRSQAEPSCHRK